MQPSTRQQELDRAYQSRPRRGHVPQISISDDTHHVTEAMSSYYGNSPTDGDSSRPLSFVSSPAEKYDTIRNPEYFSAKNASPPRKPLGRRESNERVVTPPGDGSGKTKGLHRTGSIGAENMNGQQSPPLSRQPSTRSNGDTAVQHFPLNDIDYESSPAAVAQELSNLQAIRRMSMNVDTADPDLPSFGGMPTVAPSATADEDDPSKLFWVPARLHPELAPKEFKTFVEERVDRVRRTSGSDDSLSPDNLDRSGSTSGGGLRRKKSMLSRQINTRDDYQDGAERLERKRSRGAPKDLQPKLSELEELPEDAAELIQRISLDTERRSLDSGVEIPAKEDMPILPPGGPKLKRSTHTTYRRGSQRKGERAPYSSRRVISRRSDDQEEAPLPSPIKQSHDEPAVGLSRANTTEPITPPKQSPEQESRPVARRGHSAHESDTGTHRDAQQERAHAPPLPPVPSQHQRQPERPQERRSSDTPPTSQVRPRPSLDDEPDAQRHPNAPQQKQFHSRIAAPGRTTAQLPGYKNANPLPNIVETLPDGTKVTVPNPTPQHPNQQQPQHAPPQQPSPQVQQQQPPQTQQQQQQPQAPSPQQQFPERKSSHESSRQRGGAHMRPAPGQQRTATASQTLDDISSHPSPLPGSGATRTDALTMVPTFEEKKSDKKEGGRKSSWKWILGNDDDDKEKKHSKEDKKGSEAAKLTKAQDKTRLDLLQSSIDGTTPGRGRESVVLNRDDIKLDDERKKESKKASSKAKASKEDKEAKEPGLLSAIFGGGKKKSSDTDLKAKKRKSERDPSPEPPARVLKPDIDYNWTRFSILEERAIYRMAHIKLANPKRALYSQVLLSNFMYSYLAKVQMMHPQMQIPASPQQKAAQQRKKEQEEARAREKANQPSEYSEYQKWQELLQVQSNKEAASADAKRQEEQRQQPQQQDQGANPGAPRDHDGDSSNHDDHDSASTSEWPDFRSSGSSYNQPQHQHQQQQRSKPSMNGSTAAAGGKGYSVSSTHDYLGYGSNRNNNSNSSSRHQQSSQGEKGFQQDLWDDDKEGDLW